jgi:hypothetical protein
MDKAKSLTPLQKQTIIGAIADEICDKISLSDGVIKILRGKETARKTESEEMADLNSITHKLRKLTDVELKAKFFDMLEKSVDMRTFFSSAWEDFGTFKEVSMLRNNNGVSAKEIVDSKREEDRLYAEEIASIGTEGLINLLIEDDKLKHLKGNEIEELLLIPTVSDEIITAKLTVLTSNPNVTGKHLDIAVRDYDESVLINGVLLNPKATDDQIKSAIKRFELGFRGGAKQLGYELRMMNGEDASQETTNAVKRVKKIWTDLKFE